MRLQQPGLRVTHLGRSLRFYTKGLGLRVVRRGDTRGWGGGLWVLLRDPRSGRYLELNWYPPTSMFYSRYTTGEALDHIDFTVGVRPRAEIDRIVRRLLRHGGRPTRFTTTTTSGWMASVRDPDGIWITIGRRPTRAERRAIADAAA
ncbi:MAG TPA: VOC family protein [Thermoplasmata archaeon]|nr:VOC family protein [Thermoplasmata archaeon]